MLTIDGAVYMNKSALFMSFKKIRYLFKKILHLNWIHQELYQTFTIVGVKLTFFQSMLHLL